MRSRRDSERGVALVQVLVMAVMLIMLAAGVLQIIFGTHGMVARTQSGEKARYWAEACLARRSEQWNGNPCGGATNCDFSSNNGPIVYVSCTGNKVSFKVVWNP